MARSFDQILAHFCAPALAGLKPANLVACHWQKYPDLVSLVDIYNKNLNKLDIFFKIIYQCEQYALLLVYRQKQLSEIINSRQIKAILLGCGYPGTGEININLAYLRQRFKAKANFPHEIGLFLGYPLADFYGFARNRGQNYLLRGHWKVYANPQRARQLFDEYDRCCHAFSQKVDQGITIVDLCQKGIW